jgi:putative heme-binding domain-containing protein
LRLSVIEAQRLRSAQPSESLLRETLKDESADVRLYAVRWIADERITALRDGVAKLLEGPPPSQRYYLAVLAAVDWLDNKPEMRDGDIADQLLVRELKSKDRSPEVRTLALGLMSPDHKYLSLERLQGFLEADYAPLRLEAVRTLALQSKPERFELLAEVAGNEAFSEEARLEAIMGLAPAAERYQELLGALADGNGAATARESRRLLRLTGLRPAPVETKPPADDLAAWNELLESPGDASAGRRLFFSAVGGRCGTCHKHSGRGGTIGPDLTQIAGATSRASIIASILQPNQEVAPHYQSWILITDDGKTHTGQRLAEGGDDGTEEYVDSAGETFRLESKSIELREASTASIMPSGLGSTLSIDDLRDLVTFLATDLNADK